MRIRFSSLGHILACALLWLLAASAQALPAEFTAEQIKARLIPSVSKVYPGEEILVGLQQKIIPHWHTYWRNPGDSGTATAISWTLPKDASASEILWPIPQRFNLGHITNYGYATEVTLLTRIRVPATAKAGDTFPLRAKVNLLVCEEVCIPYQTELGLELSVVSPGTARSAKNPVIQHAQAQLPLPSPWTIRAAQDTLVRLHIAAPELLHSDVQEIWFYAAEWGQVAHHAPQIVQRDAQGLVLQLTPGENPLQAGQRLRGTLVVKTSDGKNNRASGFDVDTLLTAPTSDLGLAMALLLALAGGLVLNLMPCVFPVLSIKALSLLHHAHSDTRQARLHGLIYTAGILASFAGLGLALIALKLAGMHAGWGFQFQSPYIVALIAWLLFGVGLAFSGVFEFGARLAGAGSALADRKGYAGSFFTGVLATIVATPCTAPFMGAALGYAVTQPAPILLGIFLCLGLGLALPYLIISFWPRLQQLLPRPGAWMENFRQLLAFPMYATAIWLVWVLAQQSDADAVAAVLVGMLLLALSGWLQLRTRRAKPAAQRVAILFTLGVIAVLVFGLNKYIPTLPTSTVKQAKDQNWEAYTPQRLQALRAAQKPVFINLTAAWCITCLVNERVALSDDAVISAFKQHGITYLKGDWTNQDTQITQLLSEFGRNGVPLYVIYPGTGDAKVLPQILTPDIVISAINEVETH